MARKAKKISKTTTNRGEFNRAYRSHISKKHGLCDFCRPNRGCNRRKYYGGFTNENIKYPSWKLSTKNRKQWMNKSLKITKKDHYKRVLGGELGESRVPVERTYVTIKW